jgi:hypothetical protein
MRSAALVAALIGCATVLPGTLAHGQSICDDSDLVFVGRAEAPVTFLVSGEAEIEKARRNLVRTEEEIAQLQASLDERTRLERSVEFAIRLIKAKDELEMRRAMYPPPQQVTFIPLHVVRPFRGVTESTLMVHARPDLPPMQPGEEYLVYGGRSKNMIPPFPEMGDLASLADYVEAQYVLPAASAQQRLQFLASTASGATVIGTLQMHSFGGGLPPPLGGVRILISSGTQVVETTTREDGGFAASGISPGSFDITAALSPDMTLVDRPTRKPTVREGGCTTVGLRAAVNGRVRGRILGAHDVPLDTVQLQLRVAHADRRTFGSHEPQFSTTARTDGTFEFVGVSAGTYLLNAWVKQADGGQSRTLATYYPGTDDVDAATPIVVGRATQHDGFDFVVRAQ